MVVTFSKREGQSLDRDFAVQPRVLRLVRLQCCVPQKARMQLGCLPFQAIFMMQPASESAPFNTARVVRRALSLAVNVALYVIEMIEAW